MAVMLAPGLSRADGKPSPDEVMRLARQYAALYKLPEDLMLYVVHRESRYDPAARNGPYWGLMQIRYDTARGVGYGGPASGLLKAEVNLLYGGAYLANAYMVAGGNKVNAYRLYRLGYYYEAKRKRMLARLIKAPSIAQPQVMLASVLPEPKMSLKMSFADEEKAAPDAGPEAHAAIPIPVPRPAPEADAPLSKVDDLNDTVADILPAKLVAEAPVTVPLPRPRPSLSPAPIVVAAVPLPKPRPAGSR
jgi:hypothetical protein